MDRLRAVLDRPEIVDRDVEAALRGADTADDQDRPAARFERDSSTGAQVLGVGGDGDRRP
jgi:hypothetical protein